MAAQLCEICRPIMVWCYYLEWIGCQQVEEEEGRKIKKMDIRQFIHNTNTENSGHSISTL